MFLGSPNTVCPKYSISIMKTPIFYSCDKEEVNFSIVSFLWIRCFYYCGSSYFACCTDLALPWKMYPDNRVHASGNKSEANAVKCDPMRYSLYIIYPALEYVGRADGPARLQFYGTSSWPFKDLFQENMLMFCIVMVPEVVWCSKDMADTQHCPWCTLDVSRIYATITFT